MKGLAVTFSAIALANLVLALLFAVVRPSWPHFAGSALSCLWAVGMAILCQLDRG